MNENNIFLPAKLPSNESRRLEAVRRTGELDVDNKDLFIVFNELAKQISNMPVSYTGLMDQDRQFFLCHIGMPDDLPDSIPRESTFCQFALGSTKPLIISDCKNDERFKNHPIVCSPPYVTFYGGFPIINEAGYILGTLCVTDTKQDANLSISQIELLTKLTSRLAHQLDIQTQQREFTASKTIDLLNKSIKHLPQFNISNLIGFLTVISGAQVDRETVNFLTMNKLLDKNGFLTPLARKIQKDLGFDTGVHKKIMFNNDEISSNLDNMISELEDL